jgi:hypothetical protein
MSDIPKMLRSEALIADEDWTGIYQISPNLAFAAADRIEKLEAALQVCVNVLACFERPDFHQLEQKSPIKPYALGALDVARKTLEGKDD